MSARRAPERRLPDGGGIVIGVMIGLIFWAVMAMLLVIVTLPASPEISHLPEEVFHADQ